MSIKIIDIKDLVDNKRAEALREMANKNFSYYCQAEEEIEDLERKKIGYDFIIKAIDKEIDSMFKVKGYKFIPEILAFIKEEDYKEYMLNEMCGEDKFKRKSLENKDRDYIEKIYKGETDANQE